MSWEISIISLQGDPLQISGHSDQGRQNTYLTELTRYLGGAGLKIDIFSRKENTQQPNWEDFSRGTRVIRIPIGPPKKIPPEKSITYLKEIADWIPTFQIQQGLQYDLVHSHTYLSGPVGIHLKNTWGIPFIQTFHSLSLVEAEIIGSKKKIPEIRTKIEKLICRNVDRIIANNDQEKTDLMDLYRVDPDLISIVPSGINLELFQPLPQHESRQEIAFPDDVFLITYVGGLEDQDGLDILLKALQIVDNPLIQAVIIAGPRSEKPFLSWADLSQPPYEKFITMVDEFGLDKQITFIGGKPQGQLAKYYSAGDITVIPSHYDPYGMVAKEALACGSSVIASRVSGLIPAVQENRVGSFFDPGNAAQLAEKIKIFFDQPKINQEMRANARSFAEESFSWKSVAEEVTRIYQMVLEEPDNNPEN